LCRGTDCNFARDKQAVEKAVGWNESFWGEAGDEESHNPSITLEPRFFTTPRIKGNKTFSTACRDFSLLC